MKRVAILAVALLVAGCTGSSFITTGDGHFVRDGKPYYYIGTNFWYGTILGSQGEGGNRERLAAELDSMCAVGIDNLRILVGADGVDGINSKVEPALQIEPGVYNDAVFDGLDWLLMEMAKRKMVAVLYINNAWEWSGGYSQYLAWATGTTAPIPNIDGWESYFEYVRRFVVNERAKELAADNLRTIITRTNRYTGCRYVDDPTIMAWQIANEPRAFSDDNKEPFAEWIEATAKLIKSLDPNHLVTTGSEGSWGCEDDIELWERIHTIPEIDYATAHIWPYNWGWITAETTTPELVRAISNTYIYMNCHIERSRRIGKPLVIEEFGYPRDLMRFKVGTSVNMRNTYFAAIFAHVEQSAERGDVLAGCNFWGWGGLAQPLHDFWVRGDDYTGDPAQEAQGLNSVFSTDRTTLETVKRVNMELREGNK